MADLSDSTFWAGKRVFMTGHTGFKGAWLSLWLTSMGAKVAGYSLAPATNPSLFDEAQVNDVLEQSTINTICDPAALHSAMTSFQPDIVFHLAAQALVLPSFDNPAETFATNVQGTVNVLDGVRACPSVRVVILVTSDKCYENREWHWGYRENDPMGGHDPYSASKGCAELVAASYRSSFFSPDQFSRHRVVLTTVRAGNVIGGGDWSAHRLIPDLVRGVLSNNSVLIRNPHATRPWQHVLEPLSGYIRLAQAAWDGGPDFAGGWNFGPSAHGGAYPVGRVADCFADLWGLPRSQVWTTDCRTFPKECTFLKLDISKAAACLNWAPRWSTDECLSRVVHWYKAHASGQSARSLTLTEIADYMG